MSIRESFGAAAERVAEVVRAAGPDLDRPTPCTDFDLRLLVNHLTGTTAALARAGRREPLDPEDPYGSRQDPSSGDWPAELAGNVEGLARAWSAPQAWEGTVDLGSGPMPATMIGEMAFAEILLHGWDLARATGQSLTIDERAATELRRSVDDTAELGRTMGAYSDPVRVPAGCGEFERALGSSGRDPGWTAG